MPDPVIFLENEIAYGHEHEVPDSELSDKDYLLEIGKAAVIREGKDVTITAFSLKLTDALGAADLLSGGGIEAEVIEVIIINRANNLETTLRDRACY